MNALRQVCAAYAYWTSVPDPESGLLVPAVGARRYFRFFHAASVREMELRCPGAGGGRPAEATVEAFDGPQPQGRTIFQGPLPWRGDTCRLAFDPVQALAVSIRGHWREPVQPSFMEWYPSRYTMPFRAFEPITWFGEEMPDVPLPERPAPPLLTAREVRPDGPRGMKVESDGLFVRYRSRYLHVAFSLKRPRIAFLAWDGLGTGRTDRNFLYEHLPSNASGPWLQDLAWLPWGLPPMLWGGHIVVEDNRVRYEGLRSIDALTLDAEFEVGPRGLRLKLRQRCQSRRSFLEAMAWRFVWNGRAVHSLSTLAMPIRGENRNGLVTPRGDWHAVGRGCLAFEARGDVTGLQTECMGFRNRLAYGGFLLGASPDPYGPVTLDAGSAEAAIEFRVDNIRPAWRKGGSGTAERRKLERSWPTAFAFRAEHAGFSNNSFGVNAQNCIYIPADLAPYTRKPRTGPAMVELLRYSLELALRGGPGYASFPELMHDTAPAQIIAAGSVFRTEKRIGWLREIWAPLQTRIEHVLDHQDDSGFYVNRHYTGNSRSYQLSCNGWDTFSFGHADGYSGALAYRALRNAERLADAVGDARLSQRCARGAERLKAAFIPTLLNPRTGWLAGWRSRDGELHDHAMHFVTAMAAVYGICPPQQAREMMGKLEAKRQAEGLTDFRYGLPPQFAPVPARDHYTDSGCARADVPHRADGADTYGVFTNGGVTPNFTSFYTLALSRLGFAATADAICDQLLESFDRDVFEGTLNGAECYTLDGVPSGYEGTLAHTGHVLLAIALHRGWVEPLDPEWWPASPCG